MSLFWSIQIRILNPFTPPPEGRIKSALPRCLRGQQVTTAVIRGTGKEILKGKVIRTQQTLLLGEPEVDQ